MIHFISKIQCYLISIFLIRIRNMTPPIPLKQIIFFTQARFSLFVKIPVITYLLFLQKFVLTVESLFFMRAFEILIYRFYQRYIHILKLIIIKRYGTYLGSKETYLIAIGLNFFLNNVFRYIYKRIKKIQKSGSKNFKNPNT